MSECFCCSKFAIDVIAVFENCDLMSVLVGKNTTSLLTKCHSTAKGLLGCTGDQIGQCGQMSWRNCPNLEESDKGSQKSAVQSSIYCPFLAKIKSPRSSNRPQESLNLVTLKAMLRFDAIRSATVTMTKCGLIFLTDPA